MMNSDGLSRSDSYRSTGDFLGTYRLIHEAPVTASWTVGQTTINVIEGTDKTTGWLDLNRNGKGDRGGREAPSKWPSSACLHLRQGRHLYREQRQPPDHGRQQTWSNTGLQGSGVASGRQAGEASIHLSNRSQEAISAAIRVLPILSPRGAAPSHPRSGT